MTDLEVSAVLRDAQKQIETVSPYMENETEVNPEKINCAIYMTGVNEGKDTVFAGVVLGDNASIVATLVNSLEQQTGLVELFEAALEAYHAGQTCTCVNCVERRRAVALNQMLNKSKN